MADDTPLTPEQQLEQAEAQLEAKLLADINQRVADMDARISALQAEAEARMQALLTDALARLGFAAPPEGPGENPTPAASPDSEPP